MNQTPAQTPMAAYRDLIASAEIEADPAQRLALEKLQLLHSRLERYDPRPAGWAGLFRRRRNDPPPQGLYLFGEVGRGKTMAMDLFFATAPLARKRRTHFHEFMREVHERINHFRSLPEAARDGDDPIPPIAAEIAAEAWLLCFDELEVRDVADAMILGRLFSRLFQEGVVLVATSNQAPDELYAGGINRQLFLPFIALLQERLDVLQLAGPQDYRQLRLAGMSVYHTPLGPESSAALDRAFRRLTDQARGRPDTVQVKGRRIAVAEQARGVARFSFDELCVAPLGPLDYLAIAERFHTLVVDGIPRLGPERRNEARRLITLVDILYDNHIKLVCAAEVAPSALYGEGEGRAAFERTVSRLVEMGSVDYLVAPSVPASAG
jgi:cell division protein ZapE